ncbi:ATP F0F1 synthase subunit B [Methylosinus sp. Ce-a6]|uniref:F0F1 ATP synthase subunit B family protein n=1 Tax=Methylosinus sp. Ce-a6 TaxID=2172005 RepID=UPI00135943CB|nr:ATP F0F1 synthase subunit B [Methylosinus sp. Ce-a6]
MHYDAELFVAIGFAIFLCVLLYVGAHKKLAASLDARAIRIKGELAEAERLRSEAESLLASFEKKREDAEIEAKAIVAQAKSEAELLATEARQRLEEYIARRTKQVEDKIAQAEAQAAAEVRASAADAAVKVVEAVLRKGVAGTDFVSAGIADVKSLAH